MQQVHVWPQKRDHESRRPNTLGSKASMHGPYHCCGRIEDAALKKEFLMIAEQFHSKKSQCGKDQFKHDTRHLMYKGCPLGEARAGRCVLSASDVQHSRLMGKAIGNVMKRSAYDPYGNIGGLTSSIGYTGQRREPLLGGYCLGHGKRVYQPRIMRFMTPDSYSPFHEGGINPYMYCKGDPVNKTDPSGHRQKGVLEIFDITVMFIAIAVTIFTFCAGAPWTISTIAMALLDLTAFSMQISSEFVDDPQTYAMLCWFSLAASIATLTLGSGKMLKQQLSFQRRQLEQTREMNAELRALVSRPTELVLPPPTVYAPPPSYEQAMFHRTHEMLRPGTRSRENIPLMEIINPRRAESTRMVTIPEEVSEPTSRLPGSLATANDPLPIESGLQQRSARVESIATTSLSESRIASTTSSESPIATTTLSESRIGE